MKVINNVTIKNEKEYINNWLSMDKLLKDNGMTWSAGLEPTMESDYTEEEYCQYVTCLLYTSPSPRDKRQSRMPSSA